MPHSHDHDHSGRNLTIAFFLNLGFTILEVIGGLLTNSVAILSDALHGPGRQPLPKGPQFQNKKPGSAFLPSQIILKLFLLPKPPPS